MAGCDGSLTTKDCKICNGTGFRVAEYYDKEFNRRKAVADVCLAKKNETAEAYFDLFRGVPQVEKKDLKNISCDLKNYLFTGEIYYCLFSAKKLAVKNYANATFKVIVHSAGTLLEDYSADKIQLSDCLKYDLFVLMLNTASDNPFFKSVTTDLIKTRYLYKKPTWIHVPKDLASCKEYTPDIDKYMSDFKVINESLDVSNIKGVSTSSKFGNI